MNDLEDVRFCTLRAQDTMETAVCSECLRKMSGLFSQAKSRQRREPFTRKKTDTETNLNDTPQNTAPETADDDGGDAGPSHGGVRVPGLGGTFSQSATQGRLVSALKSGDAGSRMHLRNQGKPYFACSGKSISIHPISGAREGRRYRGNRGARTARAAQSLHGGRGGMRCCKIESNSQRLFAGYLGLGFYLTQSFPNVKSRKKLRWPIPKANGNISGNCRFPRAPALTASRPSTTCCLSFLTLVAG